MENARRLSYELLSLSDMDDWYKLHEKLFSRSIILYDDICSVSDRCEFSLGRVSFQFEKSLITHDIFMSLLSSLKHALISNSRWSLNPDDFGIREILYHIDHTESSRSIEDEGSWMLLCEEELYRSCVYILSERLTKELWELADISPTRSYVECFEDMFRNIRDLIDTPSCILGKVFYDGSFAWSVGSCYDVGIARWH